MKILHTVEWYYPSIGGAQEVVRRLSEHMIKAGHEVTVATTKLPNRRKLEHNGVKIVEFAISGNAVRGMAGEVEKYQSFLQREKFDVIMNYAAQQWTADAFFEVIDKVESKKVFVPCGYSALYDPEYSNYFKKLPGILRKYDATIYLAERYRDIDFARQHKLKNIEIIPNGADEDEFDEHSNHEIRTFRVRHGVGGLMLATLGNHTAEKGHRETIEAFKSAPIGNSTLVIIGGGKEDEGCWQYCFEQSQLVNNDKRFLGKRIILMDGHDRPEVVAAFKAADLFVFLSNIEASPLVLFESAAARTPFIASRAGNQAEIATWTGSGLIVACRDEPNGRVRADIRDAVQKIVKLARNSKLRDEMATIGYQNWRQKFTWEVLSNRYLSLYEELLGKDSK